MSNPAIEVENLVKDFKEVRAIDGISFTVPRGEICALLGPNGAGKTTVIHVLLGLSLPTSGRVTILGHDLSRHRSEAVRNTNFTASYVALPYRLNPIEILRIYSDLYEVPRPAAAIQEVIELLGLGELANRPFSRLSSGQQTMVGLAKTLLNRPELIFLDEPTASLDPEHAFQIRQVLLDIAATRHMTILITSHNMTDIEKMAQRVLFLSTGRLIADASPQQLRTQFQASDLEEVFLQVAQQSRT